VYTPALLCDNSVNRVYGKQIAKTNVWHYAAEACWFPTLMLMRTSMEEDIANDNVDGDGDDQDGLMKIVSTHEDEENGADAENVM